MTAKQTSTSLTSFDATLDAIADAARKAIRQLEGLMVEAQRAGDNRKTALLSRLHRALHDCALVLAEPRT
jgi:hypothetical protein